MEPKTLRVRAEGTGLVPDYEANEAATRRYIGRKFEEVGERHGFVPTDEVVEVPNRLEYRRAVQEGHLTAVDAETARACGLEVSEAPPLPPPPPVPNVQQQPPPPGRRPGSYYPPRGE